MKSKGSVWGLAALATVAVAIVGPQSCARGPSGTSVGELAQARSLSEADITAALKTYTPTGRMDEYLMFASGGHAGQVFVIGVPSMRLLKSIAVFTPEPGQGYGFGARGTMETLEGGKINGFDFTPAANGCPTLNDAAGYVAGGILEIVEQGDHSVFIGEVTEAVLREEAEALTLKEIGANYGG